LTVDLDKRGVYRVQVRLRTREDNPQVITRSVVLRFQPPPPTVSLVDPKVARATVRAEKFALRGKIELSTPGAPVEVKLLHNNNPGEPLKPGADGMVTHDLKLVRGENRLELIAANSDPLPGFEQAEQARAIAVVVFDPPGAPEITVDAVLPEGAEQAL